MFSGWRSRGNVSAHQGRLLPFSTKWVAVTRARARRTASASAAAAVAMRGVSSVGHSTSARGPAARALLHDRFALRGRGRCLGGGERTPPRRPTQSLARQLGVARALRRLPTRLGVSNPAPTHSGESARAFLADPVLVWRLLSGRPCVASPRPRGSRLAVLARRAWRAWSLVVLAATAEQGRRANCGVERACVRSASRLTGRSSSAPPPPRRPPSRRRRR